MAENQPEEVQNGNRNLIIGAIVIVSVMNRPSVVDKIKRLPSYSRSGKQPLSILRQYEFAASRAILVVGPTLSRHYLL